MMYITFGESQAGSVLGRLLALTREGALGHLAALGVRVSEVMQVLSAQILQPAPLRH